MDAKTKFAAWRKSILLVGMMGAGKSYIGRHLANRLDVPFFDTDKEIETAADLRIADIFARYGEAHFRKGERKILARLLKGPVSVIATGGGAFVQADTRKMIQENAISLWLNAAPELLQKRLANAAQTRPLLADTSKDMPLAQRIEALLAARRAAYAQAHITVSFSQDNRSAILAQIETALMAHAA